MHTDHLETLRNRSIFTSEFRKASHQLSLHLAEETAEKLPDRTGGVLIVPILRAGLALLRSDPDRFKQFNASNGWGLYKHFVPFVEECLAACEHPMKEITFSPRPCVAAFAISQTAPQTKQRTP